ncbi:MAG: phage portal protein [Methanothermobacter sp.]|nr:phage portal protein [Methanothermobacter sp.]
MFNYHLSIKSLEKYRAIKGDTDSQALKEDGFEEYVEPKVHPLVLLSLLQVNPYHASACSIKANDILRTGYLIDGDDGGVEELLRACRPSFEFILLQALEDLQVFNYCTLEVVRDDQGEPVRLDYIPAHTVRVHRDGSRYMQTWDGIHVTYFKDYRYEGEVNPDNGEDQDGVGANEIIFIHLPSPICSYYGVPRYLSAAPSILAMQKIDEYNYAFFDNYTIPSYVITVTGEFEDEMELGSDGEPTGRTVLQGLIEDNFKYLKEAPHTPLVFSIPGGDTVEVTFTPLNTSQKELSFREYAAEKKYDIAAAHMIDPYRLGIADTGPLGGNFAEVTRRTYYESVVRPQQNIISSILTDFFQVRFNPKTRFKFNDETLLESDSVRNYALLVQSGVLTPAEARERLFGLDGGPDIFMVPSKGAAKSVKRQERNYEKNQIREIRKIYAKYRPRFNEIISSKLSAEEKKKKIDESLAEFRAEAYEAGKKMLIIGGDMGSMSALNQGVSVIPSKPLNLERYEELLEASVEDMIGRIRHYLYKVIGWREL